MVLDSGYSGTQDTNPCPQNASVLEGGNCSKEVEKYVGNIHVVGDNYNEEGSIRASEG